MVAGGIQRNHPATCQHMPFLWCFTPEFSGGCDSDVKSYAGSAWETTKYPFLELRLFTTYIFNMFKFWDGWIYCYFVTCSAGKIVMVAYPVQYSGLCIFRPPDQATTCYWQLLFVCTDSFLVTMDLHQMTTCRTRPPPAKVRQNIRQIPVLRDHFLAITSMDERYYKSIYILW